MEMMNEREDVPVSSTPGVEPPEKPANQINKAPR
jgi:hypothetical protein